MILTNIQTQVVRIVLFMTFLASPVIGAGFFVPNVLASQVDFVGISDTRTQFTDEYSLYEDEYYTNDVWKYPGEVAVSDQGRYVVYTSSENQVNLERDWTTHVQAYLKDTFTGEILLVSKNTAGERSNNHIYHPTISANGRYTVFHTRADNLVSGDNNTYQDVFLYDKDIDSVIRISTTQTNQELSYSSTYPAISNNGEYIVFQSSPENFNRQDKASIYRKNRITGEIVSIDVTQIGQGSQMYGGTYPDISADGKFVIFGSQAQDLIPYSGERKYQVFVKNIDTGELRISSSSSTGNLGNFNSGEAKISSNGKHVVFRGNSTNLVSGATDGNRNYIFRKNLETNEIIAVSTNKNGDLSNGNEYNAAISSDGRFVTFLSQSTNLTSKSQGLNRFHGYVKDIETGNIKLISQNSSGEPGDKDHKLSRFAISADGSHIVYASDSTNLVSEVDGNEVYRAYKIENPLDGFPLPEDPSEYPIVLVHGIMGGWNPEMFGLDGKEFASWLGRINLNQDFDGTDWVELNEDKNFVSIRSSLPQDMYYQFYYDWRQPNSESAQDLSIYIEQVKLDSGQSKVHILAHSMGGLVTRAYIQSPEYRGDISRFVMAGTPNNGATDAIPKWNYGKVKGKNTLAGRYTTNFLKWTLSQWHPTKDSGLSDLDRKNVIQGVFESSNGVPGIYSLQELLPTYPSLKVFLGDFGIGAGFYQLTNNPLLINLNREENLDNLYGVDTLFLAGDTGNTTAREYHIRENNEGEIIRFGGFNNNDNGDGTVLSDSLLLDCENGDSLNQDGSECTNTSGGVWQREDVDYEHNGLPSAGCREIMIYFSQDPDFCDFEIFPSEPEQPLDTLGFSVASPVDIQVITQYGKVFDADQSEEFFQENEAMYISLGETEKKLIMIPRTEDGEYTVEVTGVAGGGEYDVITWVETEDQSIEKVSSGTLTEGESETYEVIIQEDEEGQIQEELTVPTIPNTAPVAELNQLLYQGLVGKSIVFEGSESTDPDGEDTLQYKWEIDGLLETEFSSEVSSLSYVFDESYEGTIHLTVTDGGLEDTIEAEVEIRERSEEEKITHIRELIESLEATTPLMRVYQRRWIGLLDLYENPMYQQYPKIQQVIRKSIYQTAYTLRILHKRQNIQRWMWWVRPIMSEEDYETLGELMQQLETLNK